MAYSTIPKSSDYFNSTIYTGNGTASTALTTGTFQPDFCWFKNRGTVEGHVLINAIRGASYNLASNSTAAETNVPDKVSAFTSTGVTLGGSAETNENNEPLVAWSWKANGSGSANGDGSISSTVSVDTTSGFSIIQYTGNGSSGATIGHGLGVVPKVVIVKLTSGSGYDWGVYHASLGNTKNLRLNLTDAEATSTAFWNDTTPSSSLVTLGNNATVNGSGSTYIAYCFAEKQGYSKFGSYVGNGFANGTFVYTGFKPAFVMSKYASGGGTGSWHMYDNKRKGYNTENDYVQANTTSTENSDTDQVDLLSNGFKWRANGSETNTNGGTMIYMAFAEAPLVGSNNVPANAR